MYHHRNTIFVAVIIGAITILATACGDPERLGSVTHVGHVTCESIAAAECDALAYGDPDHDDAACLEAYTAECEAEK